MRIECLAQTGAEYVIDGFKILSDLRQTLSRLLIAYVPDRRHGVGLKIFCFMR